MKLLCWSSHWLECYPLKKAFDSGICSYASDLQELSECLEVVFHKEIRSIFCWGCLYDGTMKTGKMSGPQQDVYWLLLIRSLWHLHFIDSEPACRSNTSANTWKPLGFATSCACFARSTKHCQYSSLRFCHTFFWQLLLYHDLQWLSLQWLFFLYMFPSYQLPYPARWLWHFHSSSPDSHVFWCYSFLCRIITGPTEFAAHIISNNFSCFWPQSLRSDLQSQFFKMRFTR